MYIIVNIINNGQLVEYCSVSMQALKHFELSWMCRAVQSERNSYILNLISQWIIRLLRYVAIDSYTLFCKTENW